MKWTTLALSAAALGLPGFSPAEARPVSYPGGWTVMQRNNGDFSSLHIHYSPTFRDSIGFYAEGNWDEDLVFTGVQYNRLLKRWNKKNSQANAYLKLGVGQADPYGPESAEAAGFIAFAADWETRRWFTSYEASAFGYGDEGSVRHAARLGVAPYIGDYVDLHTWLMVEFGHMPENEADILVTPLIRFFYDVQLFEIGYTPETEELLVNWIIRF